MADSPYVQRSLVPRRFAVLYERMAVLHRAKGHDYATPTDPLLNFKRQALVASWFSAERDKVFATVIAQKLARLSQLLNTLEPPKCESIEDSFVDLANYALLWAEDVHERNMSELLPPVYNQSTARMEAQEDRVGSMRPVRQEEPTGRSPFMPGLSPDPPAR